MNHNSQMFTDNLPIGYPEEGMEIFLLDDNGQQVGVDNDGEIVVRSKYLASGYWNNPALSAAKFKQDPEDSEKLIYYTGDLALMRPDGCLIHKGRKDYRIKNTWLRGRPFGGRKSSAIASGHSRSPDNDNRKGGRNCSFDRLFCLRSPRRCYSERATKPFEEQAR